jgi:hypothetical protein
MATEVKFPGILKEVYQAVTAEWAYHPKDPGSIPGHVTNFVTQTATVLRKAR